MGGGQAATHTCGGPKGHPTTRGEKGDSASLLRAVSLPRRVAVICLYERQVLLDQHVGRHTPTVCDVPAKPDGNIEV